jgi:hypothetical protein
VSSNSVAMASSGALSMGLKLVCSLIGAASIGPRCSLSNVGVVMPLVWMLRGAAAARDPRVTATLDGRVSKLGRPMSESSLSELSAPSATNLSEDGPGDHKPGDGIALDAEFCVVVLFLFAVAPLSDASDILLRFASLRAPDSRLCTVATVALAEVLRLPEIEKVSGCIGSRIGFPSDPSVEVRPRGRPFQMFGMDEDLLEIGVEPLDCRCSVLADILMSYIW